MYNEKTHCCFQNLKLCFSMDCHFKLSKCNTDLANGLLLKDGAVRNYIGADSKLRVLLLIFLC